MDAKLVFLAALLIYTPLVRSTSQEDVADWFKENSEIFVILKHWNELPLVSTAWKRIKDTPPIATSRNSIKKGFDSLINMCDCNKRGGSLLPQVSSANDGTCSGRNCSAPVSKVAEISLVDKSKVNSALEEKVNRLEATLRGLNESFQNSQVTRKTSIEAKTVIDSNTLKNPVNISESDLKAFIDDHKEEQRWVRSQLIPLNYLFEKLKAIEDDVKEIQKVLDIKKENASSNVSVSSQHSSNVTNETLFDLTAKIEYVETIGKNLSTEISNMSDKVKSLSEEFHLTKSQVANLSTKIVELNASVINSFGNGAEEEYCPEKLDDMTLCSEVGESCYCFSKQQKNWTAAVEYCQSKDMYLLSLETQKEADFVTNYIIRSDLPKDFYWTSGSDEAIEGNWIWTALETNVSYANWRNQQPDGGRKENCLYLHGRDDFKWGDWLCSSSQYFICEW